MDNTPVRLLFRTWWVSFGLAAGVGVGLAFAGIGIIPSALTTLGILLLLAALFVWSHRKRKLRSPADAIDGLEESFPYVLVQTTTAGLVAGTAFGGLIHHSNTPLSRWSSRIAFILMLVAYGIRLFRHPTAVERTTARTLAWLMLILAAVMALLVMLTVLNPFPAGAAP